MIVTTVYEPSASELRQAKEIAVFLQLSYTPRGRRSLPALYKQFQTETIIVAKDGGPIIHTPYGELFFHLGMAALRIKSIRDGKPDHMTAAMGLTPGVSVLDCTLGMGTDTIVASMLTGSGGMVIGLEISPIIAFITGWGLANFTPDDHELTAAMRRIRVISADYRQQLRSLPDKSIDVVYFDPMFRRPVYASSGIRPLRALADAREIAPSEIYEACRVAKRRVVVKEMQDSPEFTRLGFVEFVGGKYSKIQYGVIRPEDTAWKK